MTVYKCSLNNNSYFYFSGLRGLQHHCRHAPVPGTSPVSRHPRGKPRTRNPSRPLAPNPDAEAEVLRTRSRKVRAPAPTPAHFVKALALPILRSSEPPTLEPRVIFQRRNLCQRRSAEQKQSHVHRIIGRIFVLIRCKRSVI